jgi:tight adherence protein B
MNLIVVGGGVLILILLIVGVVVSVTGDRSLVEDRLKTYLEEEKPESAQEQDRSRITDWVNRRVATSSMGDRI